MKSTVTALAIVAASLLNIAARGTVPPKPAAPAYDTPAQTHTKKVALAYWCLLNSSKESPAASRPQYGVKVLEILKRMPPHRITYAMYGELMTDDQNGNFLANGWLSFGTLPVEVSRTSSGDTKIVNYRWQNEDGSNAVGTYRDGHLVSKTQAGLK